MVNMSGARPGERKANVRRTILGVDGGVIDEDVELAMVLFKIIIGCRIVRWKSDIEFTVIKATFVSLLIRVVRSSEPLEFGTGRDPPKAAFVLY